MNPKIWRSLPPVAEDAPYYANIAVEMSSNVIGLKLDYSVESIAILEKIVDQLEQVDFSQDGTTLVELEFLMGCYLGELLIRNCKGQWRNTQDSFPKDIFPSPIILEKEANSFFDPINKIVKRVNSGSVEDLKLFAQVYFDLGKPQDQIQGGAKRLPEKRGPIERAIDRLANEAESRVDALNFVIECQGNPSKIQAKIDEEKEIIQYHQGKGAMAPGASPRVWIDSYILTLQEALEIINKLSSEGKTWSAEP